MTLTVELDRSSPVPLYYQLAQAIEAAIRDGELAPGDRFENELALAKRLTLSRPTTRRAIQELVDKGLLVRKRGVGTQVVQNPVHRRVELTSLFDDLARAGQEPTTQLLDYRVGPPDEEVARELNLATDREVVSIHRLRCANGEPLAVMTNHLPAEIAPDAPPPEACLINLYDPAARMGLHQDRDEEELAAPVVSFSLGATALFRVGGLQRNAPTRSFRLASGDAMSLSGEGRLAFHGVDRIIAGSSTLLPEGGRINLTLRRVTKASA